MSIAFTDSVLPAEGGAAVDIIDQTLLPGEEKRIVLRSLGEMCRAIKLLQVRGAPALGVFAGFAIAARAKQLANKGNFLENLLAEAGEIASARPTAVNLSWAARRMTDLAGSMRGEPDDKIAAALYDQAERILEEDRAMCLAIGENGLKLLRPGMTVLTHCNAGALATSRWGTALAPLLLAAERGINIRAYCDETRPLLQGARLTAWELKRAGVDVTLICDSMAAAAMKAGKIDAVLVGCDRVAANGDTANKIGTLSAAVAAKRFGVPFYVLGPSSSIDPKCPNGSAIEIELREGEEISTMHYARRMAPEGIGFWNPAFDVTDAELITAIVTEKGIFEPPFHFE